jgi:hypothetical protein
MNTTDYKFYHLLQKGTASLNKTPKSVLNSSAFQSLVNAKIVSRITSGRGSLWKIEKQEAYDTFIRTHFPDKTETVSKSSNIKSFRNSKARKIENAPVFLLRGFAKANVNGVELDVAHNTRSYGLCAVQAQLIVAKDICFVENLETFLRAEKLLGEKWLFVHKYGRIGLNALQCLKSENILVFVDYDYNGLDEYLRIKNAFPSSVLYSPTNFDELFHRYSREMRGKQKQSQALINTKDELVMHIRTMVAKHNRFLEQECLIN